ncbi:CMP-sialic acid transporter 1-like [Haliotis rubra]|uniref:CMP-sialic acid transporter 1-like n=1 Tax=Haliotis rubra TaxID=36100 RepID=UPI001EE59FB1|nr:CMP-sialic acid transporter 1-like [Haliotis rubra]
MMCAYCCISALAGVSTEYIFKRQYKTSLHVQNTLLYTFGIVMNGGLWALQGAGIGNQDERRLICSRASTLKTWVIVVTLEELFSQSFFSCRLTD